MAEENGRGFPLDLVIEMSLDRNSWSEILRAEYTAPPVLETPQIFSFSPVQARFLRLVGTRFSSDSGQYQMSLKEVRVSQATEKNLGVSAFRIADISFDPNAVKASSKVLNVGQRESAAAVAFYSQLEEPRILLDIVETPVASPGQVVEAQTFVGEAPPGRAEIYVSTDLYPCVIPERGREEYSRTVNIPEFTLIDDFEYESSPLEQGWSQSKQVLRGEISTTFDSELGSQVLEVSSPKGPQFRVDRELEWSGRSNLSLQVKANDLFFIYVNVLADDGQVYTIQYGSRDGAPAFNKEKRVISQNLGDEYQDGKWRNLERDLEQDLNQWTGRQIEEVRRIIIRGGAVRFDDISLGASAQAEVRLDR
jgi:hypothetical protein